MVPRLILSWSMPALVHGSGGGGKKTDEGGVTSPPVATSAVSNTAGLSGDAQQSFLPRSGSGSFLRRKTTHKRQALNPAPSFDSGSSAFLLALREGRLAYGFGGAGFLIPYYIGVVRVLSALGLMTPASVIAGASSGALTAASVACGFGADDMLQHYDRLAEDCSKGGTYKRLGGALRQVLQDALPADAHVRCSGVSHVSITRLGPMPRHLLKTTVVSQFPTRAELIDALVASCHLPFYSDGNLATTYKGLRVVDGGFTNMAPHPRDAAAAVKVAAVPLDVLKKMLVFNKKRELAGISLHPGVFEPWDATPDAMLRAALAPGPPEFASRLLARGESDATTWAQRAGTPEILAGRALASSRALLVSEQSTAGGHSREQQGKQEDEAPSLAQQ